MKHNFIALGIDSNGSVWTYTFQSLADAQEFVEAVAENDWCWDIRSVDSDWTVAEAIANFKDAQNWE